MHSSSLKQSSGKGGSNVTFRKLSYEDLPVLTALIKVYEEVFEMKDFRMPSAGHLQSLLEKEHIIFFVALSGSQVIGGLTAYVLPSVYFESSEVYVYDLAVKTEYQRKGAGRTLIDELKTYCRNLGSKEIFVQADLEDQHAIDFYRATGGISEDVIHFSYGLHLTH
jgi:ribosomal protein S18 acetylase RimI-like enzyme